MKSSDREQSSSCTLASFSPADFRSVLRAIDSAANFPEGKARDGENMDMNTEMKPEGKKLCFPIKQIDHHTSKGTQTATNTKRPSMETTPTSVLGEAVCSMENEANATPKETHQAPPSAPSLDQSVRVDVETELPSVDGSECEKKEHPSETTTTPVKNSARSKMVKKKKKPPLPPSQTPRSARRASILTTTVSSAVRKMEAKIIAVEKDVAGKLQRLEGTEQTSCEAQRTAHDGDTPQDASCAVVVPVSAAPVLDSPAQVLADAMRAAAPEEEDGEGAAEYGRQAALPEGDGVAEEAQVGQSQPVVAGLPPEGTDGPHYQQVEGELKVTTTSAKTDTAEVAAVCESPAGLRVEAEAAKIVAENSRSLDEATREGDGEIAGGDCDYDELGRFVRAQTEQRERTQRLALEANALDGECHGQRIDMERERGRKEKKAHQMVALKLNSGAITLFVL